MKVKVMCTNLARKVDGCLLTQDSRLQDCASLVGTNLESVNAG